MGVPVVVSASIDGTALTILFNEAVTNQSSIGYGYGFTVNINGTQVDVLYISGNNTATGIYETSTAAGPGDVVTLDYDSISGLASLSTYDPLADFTGYPVNNVGGGVSLEASTATFIIDGKTAGVLVDVEDVAAVGGFTIAGQAAAITPARKIIAESGPVLINGTASGSVWSRAIVGTTGAFAVAPGSATLEGPGETLTADVGDVVHVPNSAEFVDGNPFNSETAPVGVYGAPATWRRTVPVSAGSVAIVGIDAGEVLEPYIDGQGAAVLITGGTMTDSKTSGSRAHLWYHHFLT